MIESGKEEPLHRIRLELRPADVALFREARPFESGSTALESLLPTPRTTAGAIRTWLLEGLGASVRGLKKEVIAARWDGDEDSRLDEITGKILERELSGKPAAWVPSARLAGPFFIATPSGKTLWGVPRHLALREEAESAENRVAVERLSPLEKEAPGVKEASDPSLALYRSCWLVGNREFEAAEGYLNSSTLHNVLSGKSIQVSDIFRAGDLYRFEPRIGIGMDSDRNTTREGLLYSVSFLRMAEAVAGTGQPDTMAFAVDLITQSDVSEAVKAVCDRQPWLSLGGERRAFRVQALETRTGESAWPGPPVSAPPPPKEGRFLTYLATPGLFDGPGWYPHALLKSCDLIGAVVGDSMVVSGWDSFEGKPRKSRCAVRAGAVWFWQLKKNVNWADVEDPHGQSLCDHPADALAGWGLCFRGDWNYA